MYFDSSNGANLRPKNHWKFFCLSVVKRDQALAPENAQDLEGEGKHDEDEKDMSDGPNSSNEDAVDSPGACKSRTGGT